MLSRDLVSFVSSKFSMLRIEKSEQVEHSRSKALWEKEGVNGMKAKQRECSSQRDSRNKLTINPLLGMLLLFLMLAPMATAQTWQLVWSDEFNGPQCLLPAGPPGTLCQARTRPTVNWRFTFLHAILTPPPCRTS